MTATDFNELVVLHSDFLRPYAISLTRDPENAKDLFQETIFKALLNRDKYQFGTNLKAWLHTIMRNIFINGYRRNKRYVHTDNLPAADAYNYMKGRPVLNHGISNMRVAEIEEAINGLPQIFRVAFELHYTGYKYQEIAELLHEPLGTIKSRIHFARKMLMANLER
jgi:RNA polymerase sigma-70 factor (ECF subfamily)